MRAGPFFILIITISLFSLLQICPAHGWQDAAGDSATTEETTEPSSESTEEVVIDSAQDVSVEDVTADYKIAERLQEILDTAKRIKQPKVEVTNGVVFLEGIANSEEAKTWAAELARKTDDVVAVVNRIQLREKSIFDFSDSLAELRSLWHTIIRSIPQIAVALIVLIISIFLAMFVTKVARQLLRRRIQTRLLLDLAARVIGFIVFIIGLYIALRVSGLTQLALTVISGTGIAGLIIGIAFRDIAENFLASLLLSARRPFQAGDTISVAGHTGIVQKITTRGTLLMAFDGEFIQIPNSTIYKETIRNISANPKTRLTFDVGIGYDSSVVKAQEIAQHVLEDHSAILDDPAPSVLVHELGSSSIVLRIYFWFDADENSGLKVKSSVVRLVNRAFLDAGISMPDDAREVVFPNGVPVRMLEEQRNVETPRESRDAELANASDRAETSEGEGSFASEKEEIQAQADAAPLPEGGSDLLAEGDAAKNDG